MLIMAENHVKSVFGFCWNKDNGYLQSIPVEFSLQSDRCIPVNYRAQWIEKSKILMMMSALTKDSTFQEIQEP